MWKISIKEMSYQLIIYKLNKPVILHLLLFLYLLVNIFIKQCAPNTYVLIDCALISTSLFLFHTFSVNHAFTCSINFSCICLYFVTLVISIPDSNQVSSTKYGDGSHPFLLSNLYCNKESTLLQCQRRYSQIGYHTCSSLQGNAAAVQCDS